MANPPAPLWRDLENGMISRGFPPQFDWLDWAFMLRIIEQRMKADTGQGSAYLRYEALRADRGDYPTFT